MSDIYWVISDRAGGFRQVMTYGAHPSDAGEDVEGKTVKRMVRRGRLDLEQPNLNTGEWVLKLDRIRPQALALIDAGREREQAQFLTPGAAKASIYAQKAAEVQVLAALGADTVDAFSGTEAKAQVPAALAEASLRGVPISEVIEEYRAGISRAVGEAMRIEALAQRAKAAVRAAGTEDEIAAAIAVDWSEK